MSLDLNRLVGIAGHTASSFGLSPEWELKHQRLYHRLPLLWRLRWLLASGVPVYVEIRVHDTLMTKHIPSPRPFQPRYQVWERCVVQHLPRYLFGFHEVSGVVAWCS